MGEGADFAQADQLHAGGPASPNIAPSVVTSSSISQDPQGQKECADSAPPLHKLPEGVCGEKAFLAPGELGFKSCI